MMLKRSSATDTAEQTVRTVLSCTMPCQFIIHSKTRAAAAELRLTCRRARDPEQIILKAVHRVRLDVTKPENIAAVARGCNDINLLTSCSDGITQTREETNE